MGLTNEQPRRRPFRIAISQTRPVVGDLEGNVEMILRFVHRAERSNASLVLFPELAVVGYPPKDLVWDAHFLRRLEQAHEELCRRVGSIHVLVGSIYVRRSPNGSYRLGNAALHVNEGRVRHVTLKTHLANHDIFDESRYFEAFQAGADPKKSFLENNLLEIDGKKILVSLCRDMWDGECEPVFLPFNGRFLPENFSNKIDVAVNLSASPFHSEKFQERLGVASRLAKRLGCPLYHANQVGGFEELLFDGNSFALNRSGDLVHRLKPFEEDFFCFDLADDAPAKEQPRREGADVAAAEPIESIHDALLFGIKNYVLQSGFSKVLLGLSGGIDSAVVCALAAQALGEGNVHAVAMPTAISSATSMLDAKELASRLKVGFEVVSIERNLQSIAKTLTDLQGDLSELTKQNLQARLRGLLLMALSNERAALVLNTSNKSELAVGYATLYGDMVGALSPLGDLYKSQVYDLALRINQSSPDLIPEAILKKEPSAELSPNQKDSDSLPPYPVLDLVLRSLIEQVPAGDSDEPVKSLPYKKELVREVARRVHASEFKRVQSAPVLRVSPKAFGVGRRVPLLKKVTPPL